MRAQNGDHSAMKARNRVPSDAAETGENAGGTGLSRVSREEVAKRG